MSNLTLNRAKRAYISLGTPSFKHGKDLKVDYFLFWVKECKTKEDLIGRTIIVVKNLEPAVLRGVISEGMLLAASDDKNVILLTTEKEIKENAKIK